MKEHSRNALPQTPDSWQQVNLCAMPNEAAGTYALSVGIFDSYVGMESCKAAGIPRAWNLTLQEALDYGKRLDAWLTTQEANSTRSKK